jgi:hypothetical protein
MSAAPHRGAGAVAGRRGTISNPYAGAAHRILTLLLTSAAPPSPGIAYTNPYNGARGAGDAAAGSAVPPALDAGTQARFDALAARWLDDTRAVSSFTDIVNHPAYREIVEMGKAVIPAILRDLEREPKHWGPALEAITGARPVPREHAGRVKKIAEDWLRWARDHGYAW